MPASLRIDAQGLSKAKKTIGKLVDAGHDLTPAFNDVGEYLVRTTKERFRDQEAPDGTPWKPLSENYRKSKKRNADKILTLDGYLSGTINHNAYRERLEVGSPMEYAGTHQFGAEAGSFGTTSSGNPIPFGEIPERVFLGLSMPDAAEVEQIVADFFESKV